MVWACAYEISFEIQRKYRKPIQLGFLYFSLIFFLRSTKISQVLALTRTEEDRYKIQNRNHMTITGFQI